MDDSTAKQAVTALGGHQTIHCGCGHWHVVRWLYNDRTRLDVLIACDCVGHTYQSPFPFQVTHITTSIVKRGGRP